MLRETDILELVIQKIQQRMSGRRAPNKHMAIVHIRGDPASTSMEQRCGSAIENQLAKQTSTGPRRFSSLDRGIMRFLHRP